MAQIILDSNNNLIQGDFDNATVNNRTKFKTTTTNATTNVYAVPNGSATSAGYSVANNADPTNCSKIVMATNGSTDTQIISGINGTGTYLPLSFYTNNALAMQITTGGIISAAGGGIQFPAVQIPSADANTLDDYEEGTFTPTVGGTSVTYSSRSGQYIKIGRLVQFQLFIALSGGTPNNTIGGLPFTVSNGSDSNYSMGISAYANSGITFAAGKTYPSPYAAINTTTIQYVAGGSNTGVSDVTVANTASFYLTGTYQASA